MKLTTWIVLAVMFLTAAPAAAQRDTMRMGEELRATVKRAQPPAAPEAVNDIVIANEGGRTKVKGDFKATKLQPQIRDSLVFLLRWGKGRAPDVPVTGLGLSATTRTAAVVLPIGGLSTMRANGKIVAVRVAQFKASADSKTVGSSAVLMLRERKDAAGAVTGYDVAEVIVEP